MKFLLVRMSSALQAKNSMRIISGFVGLGAFAYMLSIAWLGMEEVQSAFRAIGMQALFFACLVTWVTFLIRFVRWACSLHGMGYAMPWLPNMGIYLAGLALTATPGKAGELLRSALLLRYKVPVANTIAAFLLDRGSDVLGICMLGALAAWTVGHSTTWIWISASVFMLFASCTLAHLIRSDLGGSKTWLVRWSHWRPLQEGMLTLEAWASAWWPGKAFGFSGLAMLAYGMQALVFFWFCAIVQTGISVADAVLIFVQATLFGAASMLPGGLGAMEAAIVIQLVDHGVGHGTALSLAISIRLVTLWFGMSVGSLSLLLMPDRQKVTG